MPEEKKCITCDKLYFDGLDKMCSEGHLFIKNNFQDEGKGCEDWESRTEKILNLKED